LVQFGAHTHDSFTQVFPAPQVPVHVPPQVSPAPPHLPVQFGTQQVPLTHVPVAQVPQLTVLPQLSTVGPQWPPEQVVAEELSVQVEQSVPSVVHWLSVQAVVV
jgi:hypothetical protein